jgi:phenylacetate-CoA ligase
MDYIKKSSAEKILRLIHTKREGFWNREREKNALSLFHAAAGRVPAYKDFLKKQKVNPARIKTFRDFQSIPAVSKKTYLKQYSLEKLCWDGTLAKPLVFTSTSGSTGEPFYFPRGHELDWQYSILAELFIKNSSYGTAGPRLIIVAFGMGVWIGGLITYQAFEIAARRSGHSISVITPGINKGEIFHALRELAPHYRETILIGYAPFLKDVLDEAAGEHINLKKLNVRVLTAAEAYTEKFRDHLVKKAGSKNLYTDTLNIYGTADIGAMAWETPTAILVRRAAMQKPKLFQDIFPSIHKTPTLAQYNPLFITFEASEGEILLTGSNTIPLIRYAVGDHGGVMSFGEGKKKMAMHGIDIAREAKANNIQSLYELPFVYVYERIDLATTLYGLQIYPETIREVLLEDPFADTMTGKFTLLTKFDGKKDQYLEINLELKKGKKPSAAMKKHLLHRVVMNLRVKNSEFRELSNYLGKRAYPRLVFWPAEHPLHFKLGVKQKWVKK